MFIVPCIGAWAFLIFFQDKVPFVSSESCAYYSQVFDCEARLTFMVFEWQKAEGVDTSTMVRLRKFHELNVRTDTTSLS